MDRPALEALLANVAAGRVEPEDASARLARLPYADLGAARVDHHRALRQGMPEAVYGPGKSPSQCVAVVAELLAHGHGPVVLTRTDDGQRVAVLQAHPGALVTGRTLVWRPAAARDAGVVVVTAGTADLPVAEEAVAVLAAFGFAAKLLADCGVAGLHRLLDHLDDLTGADAVVVVAGMEGALPSVVGGLVAAPVVAVPTSVGYGSALEGITALLAMTSSCAAGVTVVGIDNGYGAACAVARALHPR
ncbi:MAG: Circadian phase modifier [uncultured Acidimicrobiales bacterium]|uniref:Circadian phase modifier n=1 Tax=uncultured Acidimicrobiales bacterium TaxID=310071 RepID=A0A6J4I2U8_9ACTN|nr:MAG: Circadian phase modifier [uncultured Acidimicrobiales bacterium]